MRRSRRSLRFPIARSCSCSADVTRVPRSTNSSMPVRHLQCRHRLWRGGPAIPRSLCREFRRVPSRGGHALRARTRLRDRPARPGDRPVPRLRLLRRVRFVRAARDGLQGMRCAEDAGVGSMIRKQATRKSRDKGSSSRLLSEPAAIMAPRLLFILSAVALCILGLVMVYSASVDHGLQRVR